MLAETNSSGIYHFRRTMYEMQTTVKQIVIFYNRLLISRNQMQFPITGALRNSWSKNIHGPRKKISG